MVCIVLIFMFVTFKVTALPLPKPSKEDFKIPGIDVLLVATTI